MAIAIPTTSKYPLGKVTERELQLLSQTLWSWSFCDDCRGHTSWRSCKTIECPTQRVKRLTRYFDYYKVLTDSYEPDLTPGELAAIGEHEELFRIIRCLKSDPELTRAQFVEKLFHTWSGQTTLPLARRQYAITLAIKVIFTINCSVQDHSIALLEHGSNRISWRDDISFSQFIQHAFPKTDHSSLNNENDGSLYSIRASLTARKLKKFAGMEFRPTDDIRNHLKLNRINNTVELYHHTAFLKEQLRLTKDKTHCTSVSDFLQHGTLPRQLVLEVLDSLQKVLFPLDDPKSRSLLRSLISRASFDPDCIRFESASLRTPDEKNISYEYFGARLADLYEELENPTPRGWLDKWLERKSRAKHVMLATLVGVAIAIVLGMASLAVGVYQAWVGYQQWQHPIRDGNP